MAKQNVHTYIGVFLVVIGILPFLGIGLGILGKVVHILTIASGLAILLTK